MRLVMEQSHMQLVHPPWAAAEHKVVSNDWGEAAQTAGRQRNCQADEISGVWESGDDSTVLVYA
jgi:hypothetical protein